MYSTSPIVLVLFSTHIIIAGSTKLSATILNSNLPEDCVRHSAIYDGNESIFIFADCLQRKDSIFHFNITTSSVTVAGKMPDVGESRWSTGSNGKLAFDGFGNILYFGGGIQRKDICKFNPENRICENVSALPFDVTLSSSVEYNQTHILIFGGSPDNCESVFLFNLNTFEWNVEKNISSYLCYAIVANHAYKFVILEMLYEHVILLDLNTFEETKVAENALKFNICSAFTKKGSDLYILQGFAVAPPEHNNKHEIIKLDLESFKLSVLPVEGFPLSGEKYFSHAPASVFVENLNRIYFFGGVSVGRFNRNIYKKEIWYIDLNPKHTYWILFFGVLALVVAGSLIIYLVRKKTGKPNKESRDVIQSTNQESNRVWKSSNPFQLVYGEIIGSCSFAKVYKARHALNSNLNFAVKKIKVYKALQQMDWDIEKVLIEVVNLSEILNPNVVRIWNCWIEDVHGTIVSEDAFKQLQFLEWSSTQDYFLFLQMEFCDSTLRDWLKENKTLQQRMEKDVCGIMRQIVNGLRGIHEKGIIHKGIKPNNIFHYENGNLWKIGDLGLSAKGTESSRDENTVAGCRLYRSPDMDLDGGISANYSFKSDVFSLGLTFLELICIFQNEETCSKIFQQIRNIKGPVVLQTLEGFVTLPNSNLLELVSKMLATNPADRIEIFQSTIDSLLN